MAKSLRPVSGRLESDSTMCPLRKRLIALCSSFILTACSVSQATPDPWTPAPTAVPPTATWTRTSAPTPTLVLIPTATPEPVDTGWQPVASGFTAGTSSGVTAGTAPGVEWRRLWTDTGAGQGRISLVRLDPQHVRLRVLYQPAHPRTISQWAAELPGALVVANAGYFSPENQATGLVVSDGISSGRSYPDYAGMLAVGLDGQVTLRWLRVWPFNPDEPLTQAVQSFPVIVKPGGEMGFPPDADEGQRSRRTVIAQDTSGRIILLVSPIYHFSLHELAVWLTESDLEIDIAMNLDGGTSTGLWLGEHEEIDSAVAVPAVIVVEPKDR